VVIYGASHETKYILAVSALPLSGRQGAWDVGAESWRRPATLGACSTE
jgi:hypothetical protein